MNPETKLQEIQLREKTKLSLLSATATKVRDWSENSELPTPIHIIDPFMRLRLIGAAEKMEEYLAKGKVMLQTEVVSISPYGLTIKCMIDRPIEHKPTIAYFAYSVDTDKLKSWLAEHSYLEGPFSFMAKGLQLTYPEKEVKPEHYHKTIFSLDTEETEENTVGKIFLDIMVKEAVFAVHRDIFNEKEWIVSQMI